MTIQPARCLLLLAVCAMPALARDVYKCTNAQGEVAFQDLPCARADTSATVHVSDTAPSAAPAAPLESAATAPAPAAPKLPTRAPHRPPTALWLCTNAEDGSRYINSDGAPPPRRVPLGVLGYPGKSLAEAYGPGSNVMSAPELSKPPIDTSARASIATSYTVVQDECARTSVEQTCNLLRQELEQLQDKLSHARFKDEQAALGSRMDTIGDQLDGC